MQDRICDVDLGFDIGVEDGPVPYLVLTRLSEARDAYCKAPLSIAAAAAFDDILNVMRSQSSKMHRKWISSLTRLSLQNLRSRKVAAGGVAPLYRRD